MKKLTVTHKGQTFTRSTARTYSHIVVARRNAADELQSRLANAEYNAKTNYSYYVREAGPNAKYTHSPEDLARIQHIARLTQDAWLEELKAEAHACIKAEEDSGAFSKLICFAWCGRLDLAQNQAKAATARRLLDVEIVPVPN